MLNTFHAASKSSTMRALSQNLSHCSFLLSFMVLQMNSGGSSRIFSNVPNQISSCSWLAGEDAERKNNKEAQHMEIIVWSVCVINFISSFLFQNKLMQAPLDEEEVTGALYPSYSL